MAPAAPAETRALILNQLDSDNSEESLYIIKLMNGPYNCKATMFVAGPIDTAVLVIPLDAPNEVRQSASAAVRDEIIKQRRQIDRIHVRLGDPLDLW